MPHIIIYFFNLFIFYKYLLSPNVCESASIIKPKENVLISFAEIYLKKKKMRNLNFPKKANISYQFCGHSFIFDISK